MGSCVSLHRGSGSAIKVGYSLESKTENLVILPSPIKNGKPVTYADHGSKEEAFFDSQAWLDSDCDDDFLSVNGDFTPSRGSTPVHHNFSTGVNGVNKTHIEDQNRGSVPEPSPTEKKKRLSELFMESFIDKEDDEDQNERGTTQVKHDGLNLPRASGASSVCSSERTANGDSLYAKEKPIRSVQCCLPSLVSYGGFGERKRRMSPKMSPSIAVNS